MCQTLENVLSRKYFLTKNILASKQIFEIFEPNVT